MSTKTYTLELTAEELEDFEFLVGKTAPAVYKKLHSLAKQARLDQHMTTPWEYLAQPKGPCVYINHTAYVLPSETAAKAVSAVPELLRLLEAVERVGLGLTRDLGSSEAWVMGRARAARRKVDTGIHEPE